MALTKIKTLSALLCLISFTVATPDAIECDIDNNEVLVECAPESVITCDNYKNSGDSSSSSHDSVDCIPVCVCAEGFVRTTKGACIPKTQCPGVYKYSLQLKFS